VFHYVSSALSMILLVAACGGATAEDPSAESAPNEARPAAEPTPAAPTTPGSVDAAALHGDWVHLHESDSDGVELWTHEASPPLSRFRGTMSLRADGTARYAVLHPADAHYTANGTWALEGSTLVVTYTATHMPADDPGRTVTVRYTVVSANADELRLRTL